MVSFCSLKISLPNTCTVLIFFIAGLLLCLEHVFHWERIASRWRPAFSSHLVSCASSTGRCNTIQSVDPTATPAGGARGSTRHVALGLDETSRRMFYTAQEIRAEIFVAAERKKIRNARLLQNR